MKNFKAIIAILAASTLFVACQNEPEAPVTDQGKTTKVRTRAEGDPIIVSYIEVNDTNPLNAGSYIESDGTPAIDVAILFAANINGPIPASTTTTILHNNENVTPIVNNPAKYIAPLQAKGIKVLYGLLGNHTGLGFANLTDAQVTDFATKVANQVNAAGLDGVDFDDEWAKYGQNGYPGANTTSFSKLIIKLRELLPNKIISIFDIGYCYTLNAQAKECVTFACYAYFSPYGYTTSNSMGLPKSKWSPMAINVRSTYSSSVLSTIENNAYRAWEEGMGVIMTYDLRREVNATPVLNAICSGAHGTTVSHNGEYFAKDWL